MSGAKTRAWTSPSNPALQGFEALISPLHSTEVGSYLREVDFSQCTAGSFLMIPLAQTDHHGVARAAEAASGAPGGAMRICLTVDEQTLKRLNSRQLISDRVGLVLDHVSLSTSTGSIVHDVLEAVRFEPDFVSASLCSVRVDAALRALLSLSRSLGLATLGSADGGQRLAKILEYPFDYVTELGPREQGALVSAWTQAQSIRLGLTARAG